MTDPELILVRLCFRLQRQWVVLRQQTNVLKVRRTLAYTCNTQLCFANPHKPQIHTTSKSKTVLTSTITMNELLQALQEANSTSSSNTSINDSNKIYVEHTLMLGTSKSLDKSIHKLANAWVQGCAILADSLAPVIAAAAVCLLCYGTSQIIRAIRTTADPSLSNKDSKK
jgi:hypothetical protein